MNDIANTVARFRQTGLKITPQRLCIFNLLKDNRDHPSAEEIYNKALEVHPSISFTTVYKTLQTLRDLDEITELTIDPVRAHYDPITSDHVHTFCTMCSRLEDYVSNEPCRYAEMVNSEMNGFLVLSAHVYLTGKCKECDEA